MVYWLSRGVFSGRCDMAGIIRRALQLGGGMRHVILPGTVLASGMSLMVGADVIPLRMD